MEKQVVENILDLSGNVIDLSSNIVDLSGNSEKQSIENFMYQFLTSIEDGVFEIYVYAEDAVGNTTIKRADIVVDNTNPDFDIVLNKTNFKKDETVVVEISNYTEPIFNMNIETKRNGITVLEEKSIENYKYEFVTFDEDGVLEIYVSITEDAAGNTTTKRSDISMTFINIIGNARQYEILEVDTSRLTKINQNIDFEYQWQLLIDGNEIWQDIIDQRNSSFEIDSQIYVSNYIRVKVTTSEYGRLEYILYRCHRSNTKC